jgi:preprotein translocase subunit YajC
VGGLFGQGSDGFGSILQTPLFPLLLVGVVFYVVLLRPEQKRRREHEQMLAALKRGDRVVMTSGIHGRVSGVAEKVVTVEIARNVQVEVDRSAIQTVAKAPALEVREKEREKS